MPTPDPVQTSPHDGEPLPAEGAPRWYAVTIQVGFQLQPGVAELPQFAEKVLSGKMGNVAQAIGVIISETIAPTLLTTKGAARTGVGVASATLSDIFQTQIDNNRS